MSDVQAALSAARSLTELMRKEFDVRYAVTAYCSRAGYADVLSWAQACPDEVIEVAGNFLDMEEQARIVERHLAGDHDPSPQP